MNSITERTIPVASLVDVCRLFGDEPRVGPLARAWMECHMAYLNDAGGADAVRQAKAACLDAVEGAGNGHTFEVSVARARRLTEEIFPPGIVVATIVT